MKTLGFFSMLYKRAYSLFWNCLVCCKSPHYPQGWRQQLLGCDKEARCWLQQSLQQETKAALPLSISSSAGRSARTLLLTFHSCFNLAVFSLVFLSSPAFLQKIRVIFCTAQTHTFSEEKLKGKEMGHSCKSGA